MDPRTPSNAIEDPPGFDPPIYPQAQIDPVMFHILNQADAGEGVLSGCEVTPSSPEALTVDVASGQVVIGGVIYDVDATADLAIATPNITQPRFDLVCADDSGTPFIVDGLPATASPLFPSGAAVLGTSVVLASIYVEAGLAAITADHLSNMGENVGQPPAGTTDWQPVSANTDLTRNNTAALAADTVLKVTLSANTKYRIRGHVVISSPASNPAPGLRVGFLGPASPTLLVAAMRTQNNGGLTGFQANVSQVTTVAYDTTGSIRGGSTSTSRVEVFDFDVIVHNGPNSGDFAFAWGQQTAVATNSIRYAGSFLEWSVA